MVQLVDLIEAGGGIRMKVDNGLAPPHDDRDRDNMTATYR